VALSGDGRCLATLRPAPGFSLPAEYVLDVWDTSTGQALYAISGLPARIQALAAARGGEFIAGAAGALVTAWHREKVVFERKVPAAGIALDDGGTLHVMAPDGQVTSWDLDSGTEGGTEPAIPGEGFSNPVFGNHPVGFDPSGRWMCAVQQQTYPDRATIDLWERDAVGEVRALGPGTKSVWAVAFSDDGRWLAAACNDRVPGRSASEVEPYEQKLVRLWDTSKGEEVRTFYGHRNAVLDVAFSPSGSRLVSGDGDGLVNVWSAADGVLLSTMRGHRSSVRKVAFLDEDRLVSVDRTGGVKLWDLRRRLAVRVLQGHEGPVYGVGFTADGAKVASGGNGKLRIRVWDASTGDHIQSLQSSHYHIMDLAFHPDGGILAEANNEGLVVLWDVHDAKELRERVRLHGGKCAVFSRDGRFLAGGRDEAQVVELDPGGRPTERLLAMPEGHEELQCVSFSTDGSLLASGGSDACVRVWDWHERREVCAPLRHEELVWGVAFSPGGDLLAVSTGGNNVFATEAKPRGAITIWKLPEGTKVRTLLGHLSGVTGVAISPDGDRLFSASDDGTIKLWDTMTGQEILTLRGHFSGIHGMDLTRDGCRLATVSLDRTLRIWEGSPIGDEG